MWEAKYHIEFVESISHNKQVKRIFAGERADNKQTLNKYDTRLNKKNRKLWLVVRKHTK